MTLALEAYIHSRRIICRSGKLLRIALSVLQRVVMGSLVMDKYDVMEEEQNLRYFSFTFGVSQFLGALSVILVAVWMGSYNGFGWTEDPLKEFSYHPLFMIIGFVFLQGEGKRYIL